MGMRDSVGPRRAEGWREPTRPEVDAAESCLKALESAARAAVLEASSARPGLPPPAEGADLSQLVAAIGGFRPDERGLGPEEKRALEHFLENAGTALEFAERVRAGHRDGLDVRDELYGLVVRSLRDIATQSPEYRDALARALSVPGKGEAQLPLHMVKDSEAAPRPEKPPQAELSRLGRLVGALLAIGSLGLDLVKEGFRRAGQVLSAALYPLTALFSAAASLAGLRPPETRDVWRGGEHRRSALFGRQRESSEGKIIGDDPKFFEHLAVTDAYVLTGRDGTMTRLDRYLEPRAGAPGIELLYPTRRVPPVSGPRPVEETECQFDIRPGSTCLPLSPYFGVASLTFYDRRGRPIDSREGEVEIREGLLGGVVIEAPEKAGKVAYRVRAKSDTRLDETLYRSLIDALPRLETCMTPPQKVFVELLRGLNLSDREKSRLWLASAAESRFVYTKDGFVQEYLRRAGSNLNEVISGLRMGTCDSFAFHAAVMLSNLGFPAVSIVGATARKGKRDFLMNPGHAQAAVPFPEGLEVFDLTMHTVDKRSRELGWFERRAELRALQRADDLSALGSSEMVRSKLLEARRDRAGLMQRVLGYGSRRPEGERAPAHHVPGFRDSDLAPLDSESERGEERLPLELQALRALGDPAGFYRASSAFSYFPTGANVILEPEEAPAARGLDAMVNRLELERAIESARSAGSLEAVFEFLEGNRTCATLDEEALGALPPEYGRLAGYDPQEAVLGLVEEVISNGGSDRMKREAIEWLIRELRPGEDIGSGIFDEYLRYGYRIGSSTLRGSQGAAFAGKEIFDAMSDDQLLRFGTALAMSSAVWIMNSSKLTGERIDLLDVSQALSASSREPFQSIGRGLEVFSSELSKRGVVPGEATGAALIAWGAILASFASDAGVAAPFLSAFSGIVAAAGGPPALVPALERGQPFVVESITRAVREGSFGWKGEAGPGASAIEQVQQEVRARLSRSISHENEYSRTLEALESLGFEVDLSPAAGAIELRAREAVRRAAKAGNGPLVTIPGPEAPASEILFEYASGSGAPLLRSLFAISRRGGLSEARLREIWPVRSDAPVAGRVADCLKIEHGYSRYAHQVVYEDPSPAQFALAPEKLRTVSAAVMGANPAALAVMEHLGDTGAFDHPLDGMLERFALRHPKQWRKFTDRLGPGETWISKIEAGERPEIVAKGLVSRLFEHSTADERYAALRWLAAEQLAGLPSGPGAEQQARDRLLTIWRSLAERRSDGPKGEDGVRASLSGALSPAVSSDAGFEKLPWKAREAALHAYALTMSFDPESRWRLWEKAGLPPEIVRVLGDTRPLTEDSRSPSSEVWERIYRLHRRKIDVSGVLASAEAVAERIGRGERPRPAAFSYYLYERTGLLAPLSPAGDFESMRNYVPGDDLRLVDWKASARLDRIVTRQKREPEARPISLVVDAEWLSEGYERWCGERKEYPRLHELFVQLLLAERQGVDLDLLIATRGDPVRFPGVLSRRGGPGPSNLRSASFMERLSEWVHACGEVARAERSIFGPAGHPPRCPFSGEGLELRRGSILLASLADKNKGPAMGVLGSLGRRGAVVHLLKG